MFTLLFVKNYCIIVCKMTKVSKKPISAYQVKKMTTVVKNPKNKNNVKNKVKNALKNIVKRTLTKWTSNDEVVTTKNTRSSHLYGKSIANSIEIKSCDKEILNNTNVRSSKMDLRVHITKLKNKIIEKSSISDHMKYNKKTTGEHLKKFMSISSDKRSRVLILQENVKVVLEGIGMVQCLIGRCSINGFELNSHNQHKYPVYSIRPHYSILALPSEKFERKTDSMKSIIGKYGLKSVEVLKVIHSINNSKNNYAVIVFEKVENNFLAKMENIKSFSKNLNFSALMSISKEPEKLLYGEDYLKVVQEWKHQSTKHPAPVLVVAGNRNTGKSTFNRYLINSTLSSLSQVAYLECDPGQTEFASPGCVSLTIITTPILGPPFTNDAVPELTCFLGFVSPSQHPHFYLSCISFVLQRYRRDFSSLPLVVNTMGWMEGKGLEMLCSLIEAVRPSLVVQLYDRNPKNLLPSSITNQKLHENTCEEAVKAVKAVEAVEAALEYELFAIQISFNSKRCSEGELIPASLRHLKLLSCLSLKSNHRLPDHAVYMEHILDVPVYCLSMLTLHLCHDTCAAFLPSSFDASVCSLCILNQEVLSDKTSNGKLKITPICESLGMGIIHAVNPNPPGRIYLATNIHPAVLCRVNCLLTGAVKIPIEMVDEADMRAVDRVCLNYQMNVFGSTSHRSLRKFIPRKRN